MSKAATFVLAEMHRAISRKQTHVEISVKDLAEVMGEHLKVCARVDMQAEMPGRMVGWCSVQKLDEMEGGATLFMPVRRRKDGRYKYRVFMARDAEEAPEQSVDGANAQMQE
tara:strand:- start:19394 stop:19729 length:336 start_codon:yes stop_codon:yes gene_type:complete